MCFFLILKLYLFNKIFEFCFLNVLARWFEIMVIYSAPTKTIILLTSAK